MLLWKTPTNWSQMVLSGGSIKSADTPFHPPHMPTKKNYLEGWIFSSVSANWGPQEVHGQHFLGPGAGTVGAYFFSSGGSNESADTPFCPVSAAQVPQEVHGLHLLITGADAVGGTSQPIKIHAVWSTREWSTRVKIWEQPYLFRTCFNTDYFLVKLNNRKAEAFYK